VLQAALYEMRTGVFLGAGDRPDVADVGILVSDGHSTVNASRTVPEAELVKADNITMLTVVVNVDHNLADMTAIASDPAADLFLLIDYSNLESIVDQVLDRLCDG